VNKTSVAALAAALGWVITTAPVSAVEMTLGEVKAQNAHKLSKDELTALLPGSRFTQRYPNSYNYWDHNPDGTLVGRLNPRDAQYDRPRRGNWSVGNNGTYCVDWRGMTADDVQKFCAFVYRVGDNYFRYGAKAADSKRAISFTLEK
jgi:hypothetical protein